VDRVLRKVFLNSNHDWFAHLETPSLKSGGDGIVSVRTLDDRHDVFCEEGDDLGMLRFVFGKHYCLVDKTNAELIQHKLGQPWKHTFDDHGEDVPTHNADDCEKHVVALMVERKSVHIGCDRVIDHDLLVVFTDCFHKALHRVGAYDIARDCHKLVNKGFQYCESLLRPD
jgi:hypothetical protein